MFKKLLNLCAVAAIALAASVAFVPSTEAQNVITWETSSYGNPPTTPSGPTCFSGAGVTNPVQGQHSNLVWFCTSAAGVGVPRIENIYGAAGDLSAALGGSLTFWTSTNSASISNNGIATTNTLYADLGGVALTTLFASNDFALIHFVTNDVYQLVVVTNVSAGNLITSAGAKYATGTGDKIWKLSRVGTLLEPANSAISAHAGTNIIPASGFILNGRQGYPLAVTMECSNTASLRLVSGEFGGKEPNRRF
jgi:hypothetical protein